VSVVQARLRRLVYSQICEAENAQEYEADLKHFAESLGDDTYFRSKERFFKALSDSTRLRIVKMLAKREMCVCEVMVALGLTQPNASHHLNILEREGIVKKRREGKWIIYRLSTPKVIALIEGGTI